MAGKIALAFPLLLFAPFTLAQSSSSLPSCAQGCVSTAMTAGGCSSTDVACFCANKPGLSDMMSCLAGSCSAIDQAATVDFVSELCQAYGVTIDTAYMITAIQTSITTASSQAPSTTVVTSPVTASALASSAEPSASATPTSSPTSSSAPTAETSDTTGNTGQSSTASSAPASSSSLSAGAAAGLAVGVTLSVVLLALGAFLLWRHRKKTKATAPQLGNGTMGALNKRGTIVPPYQLWKGGGPHYEADGTPKSELEDRHGMSVAQGRMGAAEMSG